MKNPIHPLSHLSHGQEALWYLNQVEPGSTAYHLGVCLRLTGSLNEHALASAWTDIGVAHPQLRARFTLRDGHPSVAIDPVPATLRVESGGVEDLDRFWRKIADHPFNLESEDPTRALLLRDAHGPFHLLLCMHHIVGDLWSSATILRELSANYEAYASGRTPAVLREGMEYTEFAGAEHHWLDGPQGSAAWNSWRVHLEGITTEPILTRCVADERGGEIPITLGAALSALVRCAARERKTTPYAVLLACYAGLLGEETGRDELIIGTPATIRNRTALRNTVGYLVNAVPVRCPIAAGGGDVVSTIATNARTALARRRFPFPVLVERLRVPRISGTTPLFQSMFAYQSMPRGDRTFLPLALNTTSARWIFGGGLTAETVAMTPFDAQFPVALTLGCDSGEFSGRLQYDGRRLTAATATRLAGRFPGLISEWLDTIKPKSPGIMHHRPGERLEHLFDDTAGRLPDAIAASERGIDLTFAQVKADAETLAAGLDAALSGRDGPIALQMTSCIEAPIMIMAILKSGRAFQPIDPDEPQIRRNAALRLTGACALVSPTGVDPGILPDGVTALSPEKLEALPPAAIRVKASSQTAYLVFTSGSTGEPKAVEVGHAAVINHARAVARLFELTPQDRVLQFHTLAFDAAFEEIFPSWVIGARVVFEPRARQLGVPAFLELVARSGVTVLNLPTSYWHTLTGETIRLGLQPASNLRLLVVGGEEASGKTYSAWHKLAPRCRWINTYGPTETTITALSYEPPASASIREGLPIGRPIDGVTTLLLNRDGKPVSSGEGELLLGGVGLAFGYRGDPGMTAAKFVTQVIDGEARRFYRTGDRVKLRRDGNFEFLGRLDRQLKIRGNRVDPGEIERALRAHPAVAEAIVMPQKLRGELILSGWIVRADASLTKRELRTHLSGRLPAPMVPSRLAFIARIPRKPSGKPDPASLIRSRTPRADQYGPRKLAALFSELLGQKIGPQDDFFLSGGHSLLAIRLLGRVEARYGVRLSVSDFITAPTAKDLWKRLQLAPSSNTADVPEPVPAETPVSIQQRRALLAHEIGSPALANIVLLLRVEGRLDEDVLARAVAAVARRHSLLHSGFLRTRAGVVLRETAELPRLEHRTLPRRKFKRAIVNLARQEGNMPFALDGRSPWFRLLLVSASGGGNRHLILITHHAVADGWVFELLFDDLHIGYEQARRCLAEFPKLAPDYRTYALRQARWLAGPAAHALRAFWKQRLSGAKELHLPFHRAASRGTSWQIERREVTLSPRLSRDLRRVAASYGTTLFALAMACFKAQLHRYAGQCDILLGTVVSNRSTEADQGVLGPLQNPVLIRDEVTSNLPLRALAQRVARSLAEAQDNGALPFEQVVREALPGRPATLDGGIQFLSRDHTTRKLRLGDAAVRLVETPLEESPFELSVAVSTTFPHVRIQFEYQPTTWLSSSIEHLARHYTALLQAVAADPDAVVSELNMIPADERRTLDHRASMVHRPRAELLHQGFKAQVRKNQNATAIVAGGHRLTYGELNSKSESTAGALTDGGLKPGGLVAVMLTKGWEQIVACLAVLKAGGVYVPVDSALPAARLETIFQQGGFQAAIVADTVLGSEPWARQLCSMITIYSRAGRARTLRQVRVKPDSLAYVIFTSGSTGVPKGVMIPHQGAMTTIAEINRRFRLRPRDRVFAVSALGFDLSVFDIFGTLRAGGTIVMPAGQDPKEWLDQVLTEGATVWNSVPCLFELLLDEAAVRGARLDSLRLILLSGDFISRTLAHRARTVLPQARLVCLGGATEGAIWSIVREVAVVDPVWRGVPYGRALRGQEMFVLDPALNHCPVGVTGELFIAGAGLAKGYWRNRLETNHRFRLHPRWRIRLYRTGDQGRYLENGEIEILGRLDDQVKINGFRFELGEVEAALSSLPSVRQALAEVRTDASGNKRIVAFVAAEPGTSASTLLTHARKMLPAIPTPTACMVLDHLPLTANGKVDRTALRAMALPAQTNSAVPPEGPVEQWIAELWTVLLGVPVVGAEDDFFALGGHSLLAIKMLQRVRSHFAVDLPLSLIIEHPTVRSLAAAVGTANTHALRIGLPRRATAEFEQDTDPVVSTPTRRVDREPDAVLLTGATGHLGSALLVELLQRTEDRIYCLVRAGSKSEAEARLQKALPPDQLKTLPSHRIVAIPADLSRSQFGLNPSAFAALATDIRAAYHCAAEVNFIAPYEKLATCNVGGVREMIRLATTGGVVLHHVSSVAVFPYGGGRILHEDEDITRIGMLTGGYAQSKWTSERMVWKAISQGLHAVIYRPAQIVGHRTCGPRHDLFDHILRTCQMLRAVPDIKASIDMVTTDYATSAIRSLSTQASSLGKVFHLVHPQPVPLRDFVGFLPTPLPIVPLKTWLTLLNTEVERDDDSSLHFVSMLVEGLARADLTPPGFDCRNTIAGLRGTGIVCPPLDRQFIERELALAEAIS